MAGMRKVKQYSYFVPMDGRTYMVDELVSNPGRYGIVWYDEDGEQRQIKRIMDPLPDRYKIKTAENDLKAIMSDMFRSRDYIKVTERQIIEELDEPDPTLIDDISEEEIQAKIQAAEDKIKRKQERQIKKFEKEQAKKKRAMERAEKAKLKQIRLAEKKQAQEEREAERAKRKAEKEQAALDRKRALEDKAREKETQKAAEKEARKAERAKCKAEKEQAKAAQKTAKKVKKTKAKESDDVIL